MGFHAVLHLILFHVRLIKLNRKLFMADPLPPLPALRAFDAAARHMSFAKAAEELNVTPAAISHQIKALEDFLGVGLFRRRNRAVELTVEGVRYAADVCDGLTRLADATRKLRIRNASGALTISVLPSFAARWLLPRLKDFHDRFSDMDVRISSTLDLVDFAQQDFDLAIRFGSGHYPGLTAERLLGEELFPVCSPALLKGRRPLKTLDDLRRHTLLHDTMRDDWRLWLTAAEIAGVDVTKGVSFSDSSLLVQAAVDGMGVAIGREALVEAELDAGRLVRPFPLTITGESAYYLVYPPAHAARRRVRAFRDWILEVAKEWERS